MTEEIIFEQDGNIVGITSEGKYFESYRTTNNVAILRGAGLYIKRLEQENKELKSQNENIINEYNRIQSEIIGDIEFKELILTGITPLKVLQNIKQRNRELQAFYDVHKCFKNDFDTNKEKLNTYRSALEEIRNNFMCFRSCMIPFHVGSKENLPHKMADAIQNYCESIINKINEVLQ